MFWMRYIQIYGKEQDYTTIILLQRCLKKPAM